MASLQVISSKPCNFDYTHNDFHAANLIRIQDSIHNHTLIRAMLQPIEISQPVLCASRARELAVSEVNQKHRVRNRQLMPNATGNLKCRELVSM